MTVALVVLAGGIGAVVRALVAGRLDAGLPVGTLAVNVVGSFGLARLVATGSELATVVGTGGFGALTTWSGVAVAAVVAPLPPGRRLAVLVVAVALPITAAWIGLALG
ncbi:MAG: CrcB family protein [Actinomycetota bacterium]